MHQTLDSERVGAAKLITGNESPLLARAIEQPSGGSKTGLNG